MSPNGPCRRWVRGLNRPRGRALWLAAQRSNRRQGILTNGTMTLLRAMIEDVQVHGGASLPLQESNSGPGHFRARCARQLQPVPASRCAHRTNAVMLLTSSSKQFRLRAPGSQVVARNQFASCDSMTSRSSRLDCVVCHFYYGQAIESTYTWSTADLSRPG